MRRLVGLGGIALASLVIGCGPGDDGDADSGGGGTIDSGGVTIDAAEVIDAANDIDSLPTPDATVSYDATPSYDAAGSLDGGNTDATVPGADGGVIAFCNPINQTGCQANEKCTQLVESDMPFLAYTTCVPDGNVPNGGMCMQGAPGPSTGYDDCVAGNLCLGGACVEICGQAPDTCPMGESCTAYANTFQDVADVGLCNPECDVLTQDCTQDPNDPFGTGCYLSVASGNSVCAPAYNELPNPAPGVQGEDCMFLNTCAVGYSCSLVNDPINATGNVCAKFCDSMMSGGPICDDTGSATTCTQINMFYGDADQVPDEVGFCIDCAVWTDVPACMP
jgi:hypothetical protein